MKIVVWGVRSGLIGLREDCQVRNVEIVAFADSNAKLHGLSLAGREILDPERLASLEYDFILVASTYYPEIRDSLLARGFDAERILNYIGDRANALARLGHPNILAQTGSSQDFGPSSPGLEQETEFFFRNVLYTDQPAGLRPVEIQRGASRNSLEWLKRFHGHLLDSITPDVRTSLKERMLHEFEQARPWFAASCPGLTERQQFVAFLALRVGGSFTTYAIRTTIPDDLESLLRSHRGNCSDHAFRLAMVLDSVGIDTAIVTFITPSMPGHVIVDAYDKVDGSGYLLDSLFNVALVRPETQGSFLTAWSAMSPEQREDFFRQPASSGQLFFPAFIRYVDADEFRFARVLCTEHTLNGGTIEQRKTAWANMLTTEWDECLSFWKTHYPNKPPRNLRSMAALIDSAGLRQFAPAHGVDTNPLWKAAGLSVRDTATPKD